MSIAQFSKSQAETGKSRHQRCLTAVDIRVQPYTLLPIHASNRGRWSRIDAVVSSKMPVEVATVEPSSTSLSSHSSFLRAKQI